MTKVQVEYDLLRPLDEALMKRVADAHATYGLQHVRVGASANCLIVDYDASRLTEAQVESALHRAGLPVKKRG